MNFKRKSQVRYQTKSSYIDFVSKYLVSLYKCNDKHTRVRMKLVFKFVDNDRTWRKIRERERDRKTQIQQLALYSFFP